WLDAGIRRGGRARRDNVQSEIRSAYDEVLSARELRVVHSLPRRNRLAEEDFDRFPCRRRAEKRYRQHVLPFGKHAGTDIFPAGRCRSDADYGIYQKIPKRVRRSSRRPTVSV